MHSDPTRSRLDFPLTHRKTSCEILDMNTAIFQTTENDRCACFRAARRERPQTPARADQPSSSSSSSLRPNVFQCAQTSQSVFDKWEELAGWRVVCTETYPHWWRCNSVFVICRIRIVHARCSVLFYPPPSASATALVPFHRTVS